MQTENTKKLKDLQVFERKSRRTAEIKALKEEMGMEFIGLAIINHGYNFQSGIQNSQDASLGDARLIQDMFEHTVFANNMHVMIDRE